MQEIKGYDSSYLFDEVTYKRQKATSDYFMVDGQIIKDYKNKTIDPYSTVFEFGGFYFSYDDVDSFIEFLLDSNKFSLSTLLDEMTESGRDEFLRNGFLNATNNFVELFGFKEVPYSQEEE